MNGLDYEKPNSLSRQNLVLLKLSLIGCGCLLSIGLLVYAISRFQTATKTTPPEQIKPEDGR
ncbi:MAG: hypothetical protein ACKPH7_06295, partial [Planktothrix sp.]|uniref:hypothetical protein n=1 Tax=Planktothrix sp. TaxID=3088171 RepID=UPI0038D4D8E5